MQWKQRLVPTRSYLQKENGPSTFYRRPLNGFLMSSLCPLFWLFLVFLLYHGANKSKMHYWTDGWFLIWFDCSRKLGLGLAKKPGEVKKRPNCALRWLSFCFSFSFLPTTWSLCSEAFRLASECHVVCFASTEKVHWRCVFPLLYGAFLRFEFRPALSKLLYSSPEGHKVDLLRVQGF